MILRPRPRPWQLLFIMRGSVIPAIASRVIGVGVVSVLADFVARAHPEWFAQVSVAPFTLLGLVLSIFLSFRNNACYDRWWEARRQWGQLIVEARGFARSVQALLPGDAHAALRDGLLRATIGFVHALNARLRDEDAAKALAPWLPPDLAPGLAARITGRVNVPDGVLHWLNAELAAAQRAGAFDVNLYPSLARPLEAFGSIQASCERIHSTPLPFPYTLLLHRTAHLFCILLPFGVASVLGWATPLLSMLMAYAFFGLDVLGDEMEEPFGREENDLPLDALTRTVEIELLDALGVKPLPPSLLPERYVLT